METKKRIVYAEDVLSRINNDKLIIGQIGTIHAKSAVNRAKTVDAVEVVRCKDCIHYDFGVCLKIYSDGDVSQYAWQARNEDDFCSYGERKDDG